MKGLNLALRGFMEAGIVLGFGYWGYHLGGTRLTGILLAIVVAAAGFGFWGLVDFHKFGRISEYLRLTQELIVSGLAALLLYTTGQHVFGWALVLLSIVYHAMVYIQGDTLLKDRSGGQ